MIPNLYNLSYQQYSQLTTDHPELSTSPACVIQSFSSNLPPFMLFQDYHHLNSKKNNKNIAFDVIDACAAPGNKTLQLS
jgi:16S rRNA C967 or C1407 C5-methylase (RsmB/RsmF family)